MTFSRLQRLLCCLLLVAPFSFMHAQNLSKLSFNQLDSLVALAHEKGDYAAAIPYISMARDKAKTEFGSEDSLYALYTDNLGYFMHLNGEYKASELYFLEAMKIREKTLGYMHDDYATSSNNLAMLYQDMGLFEEAEPLLLSCLNVYEKIYGIESEDYARSLNNLAFFYTNTGSFEKAEPLFIQASNIRKKILGPEAPDYATSINNLGVVYWQTGNFEKAEPLLLLAKDIRLKALGEEHPQYSGSLNNLAMFYQDLGEPQKAEMLFIKAKNICAKVLGEEHPQYAASVNNLAALYKDMKEFEKSKSLFLLSKSIDEKVSGKKHPNYAQSLNNLASLYFAMQQLDSSLYYALKSIEANSNEIDSSIHELASNNKFSNKAINIWNNLDRFKYFSDKQLGESVGGVVYVLQKHYYQTKDTSYLQRQFGILEALLRLHTRVLNEFSGDEDKLFNLSTNKPFILAGIRTASLLKDPIKEQKAFSFSEQNKGVLLLNAIKSESIYKFGGLPDSIIQKEKMLQVKQSELNAALLETNAPEEKERLFGELNKTKQEINLFTKSIEKEYPSYQKIKYQNKTASITDIQNSLNNESAILEFVLGDSVLYVFYLDKKQFSLNSIYINNDSLKSKIKALRTCLLDYEILNKKPELAYEQYTKTAYWFYENLLQSVLSEAKGIKNLIIVPDGELAHLPFESFLLKKAAAGIDYKELPYLLTKYSVSYNYSASLWKENREAKSKNNNGKLFAVAANYSNKNTTKGASRSATLRNLRFLLTALPAAREEVAALEKTYSGFFAFDDLSTEKVFKEKAKDYAVLHLAMHGLLNQESPILSSLAFTEDGDSLENNFLQAYEISKMQLNADLVVLSACETGYGKFETGNGTASLARSFMYAGVPSLVVSLWQVNDASTSVVMQLFYKNLSKGMNKAEALQKAKLEYISSVDGANANHPAFWAPFILIGDDRPIHLTTKSGGMLWWIVGGISLLALGGGFLVLNRRKEK